MLMIGDFAFVTG